MGLLRSVGVPDSRVRQLTGSPLNSPIGGPLPERRICGIASGQRFSGSAKSHPGTVDQ